MLYLSHWNLQTEKLNVAHLGSFPEYITEGTNWEGNDELGRLLCVPLGGLPRITGGILWAGRVLQTDPTVMCM